MSSKQDLELQLALLLFSNDSETVICRATAEHTRSGVRLSNAQELHPETLETILQ